MLYSNESCDAAIPDAAYAMVRAGVLAQHAARDAYVANGTHLEVSIDEDYVGGCSPRKCYSRTLEEEDCDATKLPICEIEPSVCVAPPAPATTMVHGPLDVDTSCSPSSEGRCVDVRITASDGLWSAGRTWITATCHAGRWRLAGGWPIEVHTI
jgi:hypothetical protein